MEVMREDMDARDLNKDILFHGNEWRRITHIVDPVWSFFGLYRLVQVLEIKWLVVGHTISFKLIIEGR